MKRFIKTYKLIQILKNQIVKKDTPIILGRWETSGKYINIKATQANLDSCCYPNKLHKYTKLN